MKKIKTGHYSLLGLWLIGCILRFLYLYSKGNFNISRDEISSLMVIFVVGTFLLFTWSIYSKKKKKVNENDIPQKTDYYKNWKEGTSFDSIKIGNQEWSAEDFEKDGTKNPNIDNNFFIPDGWRIPSIDDFKILQQYLESIYESKQDVIKFLEKNWYRNKLKDDYCKNCDGSGVINEPNWGVLECKECNGVGFLNEADVSEFFWTNDLNKDGKTICAFLQKSDFGFCTVDNESVVHLRLVRSEENIFEHICQVIGTKMGNHF